MIREVIQVKLGVAEKNPIGRVGLFILKGKGTLDDIKLIDAYEQLGVIIGLLRRLDGFLCRLLLLRSTPPGMGVGKLDPLNS
jgi:hypothetical protein